MAERKTTSSTFNQGLYEFRLNSIEEAVKENTKVTNAILEKVNSLSYVPVAEFTEFKEQTQQRLDAMKAYNDKKFRTKEDGKTFRTAGVSFMVAMAIALGTIILNFVLRGGLSSGPGN